MLLKAADAWGGSNTSAVPNKGKAVVKLLIECNCRDRIAVQAAQLTAQERQEGSSLWPQHGTCPKEPKKQVVLGSGICAHWCSGAPVAPTGEYPYNVMAALVVWSIAIHPFITKHMM